jgi:hypothetical protein
MTDHEDQDLKAQIAFLRGLVDEAIPLLRATQSKSEDELADRMREALAVTEKFGQPEVCRVSDHEAEDHSRHHDEIFAMRFLALDLGIRRGSSAYGALRSAWDTGREFGIKARQSKTST